MIPDNINLSQVHMFHLTGREETGFVKHIAKQFGFTLRLNIRGDNKCFVLVREPTCKRINDEVN